MSNKVIVKVNINGMIYPISCNFGEEERLLKSSNEVNKAIKELANISEEVGETRLLAMTCLILADKLIDKNSITQNETASLVNNEDLQIINDLVIWLDKTSERMNKVANLLENK